MGDQCVQYKGKSVRLHWNVIPFDGDPTDADKPEWHETTEPYPCFSYAQFRTEDGRVIRWKPYKLEAQRQGYPSGRWQEATEYGGWKNCSPPIGRWRYMLQNDPWHEQPE